MNFVNTFPNLNAQSANIMSQAQNSPSMTNPKPETIHVQLGQLEQSLGQISMISGSLVDSLCGNRSLAGGGCSDIPVPMDVLSRVDRLITVAEHIRIELDRLSGAVGG